MVLGDSLSAGYGLPVTAAFPTRLGAALKAKGLEVQIVNAGVSGDTASGGRDRLEWSVPADAEAVIVELGANDMLRGIDPQVTEKALTDILDKLKQRKAAVLLAGMLAAPNMGADYKKRFDALFASLAARYDVVFYPFFLDGVAGDGRLNQPDGIHPSAAGVDIIVERILPKVEELIGRVRAARGA